MNRAHRQSDTDLRFEWGLTGATAVVPADGVAVVIDVLSFTTTLSVAVDAGAEVIPYRWGHDGAAAYAATHGAVAAVGRRVAGPGMVSLSPGTVRAARDLRRLLLPSPNGSTIASALDEAGAVCVGACLRNASAVAHWLAAHPGERPVAVIAAGEKWPDGGLRPAVEDLWGAGAVLSALTASRPELTVSPEVAMAISAWEAVRTDPVTALHHCASGRELVEGGFPEDVAIAAEVDRSDVVPLLVDGVFRDTGAAPLRDR